MKRTSKGIQKYAMHLWFCFTHIKINHLTLKFLSNQDFHQGRLFMLTEQLFCFSKYFISLLSTIHHSYHSVGQLLLTPRNG